MPAVRSNTQGLSTKPPSRLRSRNQLNPFRLLDASYQLITDLVTPLEKLNKRNPKLHVQLTTAGSSVALNVSEGRGRAGKDRRHHWRIASGSAQEVVAILEVSERLGYFVADDTVAARHTLTRLQQMLWRMTH